MSLFDDPIREEDMVWSRECALCDHACLEREWLCDCCQQIDRPSAVRYCLGEIESNVVRPLLPPHWPELARGQVTRDHHLTVELEVNRR